MCQIEPIEPVLVSVEKVVFNTSSINLVCYETFSKLRREIRTPLPSAYVLAWPSPFSSTLGFYPWIQPPSICIHPIIGSESVLLLQQLAQQHLPLLLFCCPLIKIS